MRICFQMFARQRQGEPFQSYSVAIFGYISRDLHRLVAEILASMF